MTTAGGYEFSLPKQQVPEFKCFPEALSIQNKKKSSKSRQVLVGVACRQVTAKWGDFLLWAPNAV